MKPKKLVRRVIFCFVALTMLVLSSTAVPQVQASVITYEKTGTIEEDFNNGKLKVLRDRIMDYIFNLLDIFEQHKIIFRRGSSENIYELTSFLSKNKDILKQIPEKIADDDNLTLLINQLGEIAGQSNLENETTSPRIVEAYLTILLARLMLITLPLFVLSKIVSKITLGPFLGRRMMGKTAARISAICAIVAIGCTWLSSKTGQSGWNNLSKLYSLDALLYLIIVGLTHPISFFPRFIATFILYGIGLIIAILTDIYLKEKL